MRLQDMDEPALRRLMIALASAVVREADYQLGERVRFCLVVFNDLAVAQYIGNCTRETMIQAMRETADRLEAREDVTR